MPRTAFVAQRVAVAFSSSALSVWGVMFSLLRLSLPSLACSQKPCKAQASQINDIPLLGVAFLSHVFRSGLIFVAQPSCVPLNSNLSLSLPTKLRTVNGLEETKNDDALRGVGCRRL